MWLKYVVVRRLVPLPFNLWEEELVNAIGCRLSVFHDNIRIDANQLSITFKGAAVDKDPLDILWLCVENDLTDCVKPWRKVHSIRIKNNQVGFLARG